jgi:hypothetical protein
MKQQLINWNELKPKKDCLICNINEDYVCFECEDIFVKQNYPNYFYNKLSMGIWHNERIYF